MMLNYRISLWCYYHYVTRKSWVLRLGSIIEEIASNGYGIELWSNWKEGDEQMDLFSEKHRDLLRRLLEGVPSSWHTAKEANTYHDHRNQIDTASYVGSDVIVVHAYNLGLGGEAPDFDLAGRVLDYAQDENITIVLENGTLPTLKHAIDQLENLKICIDTGHVYNTAFPMKNYIDNLKGRLRHLHLQDHGHYVPGMAQHPRRAIRKEDWLYLFEALEEINFEGAAVFEIRPLRPLQTAARACQFFDTLPHN